MGRIKFTDYVPQNLLGVNSASKTLVAEVVTGTPISTGAVVGESFYISKGQAAQLSTPYFPVYAGWYRVVLVDSAAAVANIAFGAIGGQLSLGTTTLLENQVTDASKVLNLGIAPCVFLTGGLGLIVSSAYSPLVTRGVPAGGSNHCRELHHRSGRRRCNASRRHKFELCSWVAFWYQPRRVRWQLLARSAARCTQPSSASQRPRSPCLLRRPARL